MKDGFVMAPRAELVRLQENMDPHRGAVAWGIVCGLLEKPAEQHQGEPAAWRGLNELGEVVTEWVDGVPPSSMVDLYGNSASFASIEQAYTHADPGEVERLRAALQLEQEATAKWQETAITLGAQLAEALTLLREIEGCPWVVDEATIPKAGIESAPQQVVGTMHVGLMRLRKIRAALERKP
jgi:hypothetical protein